MGTNEIVFASTAIGFLAGILGTLIRIAKALEERNKQTFK